MLKIICDRKLSGLEGFAKITPGIFLELPTSPELTTHQQASLLNQSLATISPYLTQFFYADEHWTSRPSLSAHSALTLGPSNKGIIELVGPKDSTRSLTALLKTQLHTDVASLVHDIELRTTGRNNYAANHTNLQIATIHTNFAKVLEIRDDDDGYIAKRMNTLNIEVPECSLFKHLCADSHDAIAITAGLQLNGYDPFNLNFADILDDLKRSPLKLSAIEASNAIRALKRYEIEFLGNSEFRNNCIASTTSLFFERWQDHSAEFAIHWAQDRIGGLKRLAYSGDIRYLRDGDAWACKMIDQANGVPFPKVFESVSRSFPAAIHGLLPERLNEDMKRLQDNVRNEALLKKKPYTVGDLYFHHSDAPVMPKTSMTKIESSLNDISNSLIFRPDFNEFPTDKGVVAITQFCDLQDQHDHISVAGYQAKSGATIAVKGGKTVLKPATHSSMTHLIKFPMTDSDKQGMVYAELFGMLLATACGVKTAPFRCLHTDQRDVVSLHPGAGSSVYVGEPCYITEMFDRPQKNEDFRCISEDFLSASKLENKYRPQTVVNSSTGKVITQPFPPLLPNGARRIESVAELHHTVKILADVVDARCSSAEHQKRRLFRQLVVNTIVGNGDAHLKNFTLLHKVTEDHATVELSPAYDIVATRALNPRFFNTPGVCLLGDSYCPTKEAMIDDAVNHMGLSAKDAELILNDVVLRAQGFLATMRTQKSICEMFTNTKLGEDLLTRAETYALHQCLALFENKRVMNEEAVFSEMYPSATYLPVLSNVTDSKDSVSMDDVDFLIGTFGIDGLNTLVTNTKIAVQTPDNSQEETKSHESAFELKM